MIKTKVLLSQVYVILRDFGGPVFDPLVLLLPNIFILFGFQLFPYRVYLIKVILNNASVH